MIAPHRYHSWWAAGLVLIFLLSASACGRDTSPPEELPGQIAPVQSAQTSATATLPPTATVTPQPSATPTPTPAPLLRQLTQGGCCVEPFWSVDGNRVLYLDRPAPDAPAGIWGVGLPGEEPELVTERLGIYSPDQQYLAYPEGGQAVVEQIADGQNWIIPSGGREVSFSLDSSRLVWTQGQSGPPFDTPLREVWVSQVDASQARPVASLYGGGFAGWFPDGNLLVSGRLDPSEALSGLWKLSVEDGSIVEIARGSRLRGIAISPGGSWLAYQVTSSGDPSQDGLWLAKTDASQRRRLDLFGAYRWRDDGRLYLIPLDLSQPFHVLWEVEAASGVSRPLTDPAITPFKIANGDWSISPDGRQVAFVSAEDHNIWLLSLP